MGGSYPSAEKQSVYSTADWATVHLGKRMHLTDILCRAYVHEVRDDSNNDDTEYIPVMERGLLELLAIIKKRQDYARLCSHYKSQILFCLVWYSGAGR